MFEYTYNKDHIVKLENLLYVNVYVPKKHEGINGCSRLLVKSLPFQYKLWVVVKMPIYNFIGWNEEGDTMYVHYEGLENYLETDINLFNVSAIEVFFNILDDYGFSRLPYFIDGGRIIYAFKHELFLRECKQFLAHMKSKNLYKSERIWGNMHSEEQKRYLLNERMSGDLCFMCHGNMSFLQKGRMVLKVALKFDQAERIVESKIKPQVQYHSRKRRCNTYEKYNVDIPTLDFPAGMYENPYDSSVLVEDFGRPFDFAGYFGKASDVQVEKFYGNLTPKFINDPKNGLTIKKICYQKPGTCPEPEETFPVEIEPDIAVVNNMDLMNGLNLNVPMDIPIQPDNNNDSYIYSLGDTEFAKQLVTQYESNPASVPKIIINTKEVPKVLEAPKKYLSMPGCENFNPTKSKRFNHTTPRILRPHKMTPQIRKISLRPEHPMNLTSYEEPTCSNIINKMPFMIGRNLSDSSDSSFEAPRLIKSREISPEIDFKLSESSDEPLPRSFMKIKPLPIEIKKFPKENKRTVKEKKTVNKENKKPPAKEIKKKPVKERKKYTRAPKDPNAPPKPTKTGKKRGPYKKKVKPIVDPNSKYSGTSAKARYILEKYLHNVDLDKVDLDELKI